MVPASDLADASDNQINQWLRGANKTYPAKDLPRGVVVARKASDLLVGRVTLGGVEVVLGYGHDAEALGKLVEAARSVWHKALCAEARKRGIINKNGQRVKSVRRAS